MVKNGFHKRPEITACLASAYFLAGAAVTLGLIEDDDVDRERPRIS